jgi:hypothetical protein
MPPDAAAVLSEPAPAVGSVAPSGPSRWATLAHVAAENPLSVVAAFLLLVFVGVALGGPSLAPYDPFLTNAAATLQPPSWAYWFGTDALGRDIFSRVLVGARIDLGIALGSVTLAANPVPSPAAQCAAAPLRAGLAQHGLGHAQCRRPLVHRARRATTVTRVGADGVGRRWVRGIRRMVDPALPRPRSDARGFDLQPLGRRFA